MNSRRRIRSPRPKMQPTGEGVPINRPNTRLDVSLAARLSNVRFTSESRHQFSDLGCPLRAKSGHGEARLIDQLDARNGLIILA